MRTIDWVDGGIELVDQTRLPHEFLRLRVTDPDALVDAVQRLAVRGAPALGVAGALGVALLATSTDSSEEVRSGARRLRDARPTAVNLSWGVDRALRQLDRGAQAVLTEALAVRDEDIAASVAMGENGAATLRELLPGRSIRAMTVCNAGGLAAVERGTALSVVQTLHEQGRLGHTLVTETRPLLQGARLTAWELRRMGAEHSVIVDSAGPFLLNRDYADAVLVGADRIAANGDTANKVGSFSLALAARQAGVPFLVVAPESSIDPETPGGDDIAVEERDASEVVAFDGIATAPEGTGALNPAFDVTPAELITAIVTENRVVRPGRGTPPVGTVPERPQDR
ncbi:methylthioribose-1-phosphate isomerase [Haloactinospora alba]|uniref:Methylthioribose-1-phosphate isomerase n=1 Tax=Haloactinospora alba TaxID=405555 RepID=A0A543NII3_9ACTN|nr:S-methyl-5-thioribose-1-phosphate isomerase [Haloactinospora alba]TQN31564.1 methylthioribose-1-phosphate isomerase [Haloactinospora alba]